MVNALLAEHPENDVCTWGKNILKMKQHRYTVAHRGTDSMGTLKSYHSTMIIVIKLQAGLTSALKQSVGRLLIILRINLLYFLIELDCAR